MARPLSGTRRRDVRSVDRPACRTQHVWLVQPLIVVIGPASRERAPILTAARAETGLSVRSHEQYRQRVVPSALIGAPLEAPLALARTRASRLLPNLPARHRERGHGRFAS
jgi:hypothetical protein